MCRAHLPDEFQYNTEQGKLFSNRIGFVLFESSKIIIHLNPNISTVSLRLMTHGHYVKCMVGKSP